MSPAGFEAVIPASERPSTYALDRAATGSANTILEPVNSERPVIASIRSSLELLVTRDEIMQN